ncbi:MAG TPA: DHHA1 domain-containing protein [Allocoleopsis sp.]
MTEIQFDYIVYHTRGKTPCPDGIASAWVCKKYNANAELIGMKYGDDLPILPDNCGVICVDFSFTSSQLLELSNQGIEVTIIDHHVSAFEELTKGQLPLITEQYIDNNGKHSNYKSYYYDINECGATLTWKTLFPDKPIPCFLEYVKDRDLWLHALPKSDEMHEAIGVLGRTFCIFNYLELLSKSKLIETIAPIGNYNASIKRDKVSKICNPKYIITETIDNYEVIGVVLKPFQSRWASDIATYLYQQYPNYPFVFVKTIDNGYTKYSLRSSHSSGFDVRLIAEKYGGGGHKNAAGFSKLIDV